jgi:hypothetical protein
MVCFGKPLLILGAIGAVFCLIYRKAIAHFLDVLGVIMEYVFMAAAALTVAGLVIWIMRAYMRRQARRGACLTCEKPCQLGEDHVGQQTRPIPVHSLRLRNESTGAKPLSAVPQAHAADVTDLAAWKERKKEPSVG